MTKNYYTTVIFANKWIEKLSSIEKTKNHVLIIVCERLVVKKTWINIIHIESFEKYCRKKRRKKKKLFVVVFYKNIIHLFNWI